MKKQYKTPAAVAVMLPAAAILAASPQGNDKSSDTSLPNLGKKSIFDDDAETE